MLPLLRVVAVVMLTVAVSGCGSNSKFDEQVANIQSITVKTCKYLPTAATVAAILTSGNAVVTGATTIATAICSAVSAKQQALIDSCPMVNGICIQGEYVRE